jgi:hypothetical protein
MLKIIIILKKILSKIKLKRVEKIKKKESDDIYPLY